ncbi:MAG: CRTAC1 family protein [Fuerstiella sp.]|nr:CRTAC1 family protein [Fuerstiella sp.]MCP4857244.1 CRTAC1 family protein [Fuerstiella sp.]
MLACAVAGCGQHKTDSGSPDVLTQGSVEQIAADSTTIMADDDQHDGAAAQNATIQLVEVPVSQSGVDFQHVSGDSAEKPFPAANGSGMGMIDCDLDGRVDLYFATGRSFPLDSDSIVPVNRIYRNLGEWRFQDVTSESGLGDAGYGVAIAVGDFDSDGFPDVYVTRFGQNHLYRNLGDGTFELYPMVFGGDFSTSAAFLDFDADGLLDLYVCNYGEWSFDENPFCGDRAANVRIFCSPKSLKPEQDRLLRNSGDGTFHDVTAKAGLDELSGRAQGVLASDVDGDGDVDLYIGNDIHPNFLYLNSGGGEFSDVTEISGTAYDRNGQMQAGMGVAGGDVNRDGLWDLFVTNFEGEYNTLYLQHSSNDFHDVSTTHGLAAASKPWVGWGTAIVDLNLDGWKDLIVTNGHVDDNLQQMARDVPYEQPPLVWQNNDGRFQMLGSSVGSYFQASHPGRGLATADLDNDGDSDVVITHQDQSPAVLRNDAATAASGRASSLCLRLIGKLSDRDAVGCRVTIQSVAPPQIAQVENGGSYLSAHDQRLILAVDQAGELDIEIQWPSGVFSRISGLDPTRDYDIVEPAEIDSAALVFYRPS